mmetsp:Transcript_6170/g.14330  ORF Transcript_6170/g.14330 Transcript_6170/m.14330 type:complete len:259 (+) Transcript_6170:671-1447(+)
MEPLGRRHPSSAEGGDRGRQVQQLPLHEAVANEPQWFAFLPVSFVRGKLFVQLFCQGHKLGVPELGLLPIVRIIALVGLEMPHADHLVVQGSGKLQRCTESLHGSILVSEGDPGLALALVGIPGVGLRAAVLDRTELREEAPQSLLHVLWSSSKRHAFKLQGIFSEDAQCLVTIFRLVVVPVDGLSSNGRHFGVVVQAVDLSGVREGELPLHLARTPEGLPEAWCAWSPPHRILGVRVHHLFGRERRQGPLERHVDCG